MTRYILEFILYLVSFFLIWAFFSNKKEKERKEIEDEELKKLNLLKDKVNADIQIQSNKLEQIVRTMKEADKTQEECSRKAFEQFCEILDKDYDKKVSEYDNLCETLKTAYSTEQLKLLDETNSIKKDLDKIRSTRAAAIEAQRKEKEIKEKLTFYSLNPTKVEIEDIKKLENIKPTLNNQRILSMLIWSTFFQKPMTALCNNVLGTTTITGIYKITNQNNNMCYIGQSVDIATRWKQHAKCGLGIDTPAANKLYKAIQEDGIWNFSWELLEECPREYLDEKEKFYIELYQAYEYGYNSNTGNNRRF